MNAAPSDPTINLVLDRRTTKEVLRAVLHAILFHRLFGTVKPQTFDVLDITMPGVDDPDLIKLVDEKVAALWKGLENVVNKRAQIFVTFSERRPRKSWGLNFIIGEEEVAWEQWTINAEIKQPTTELERQTASANLTTALNKSLQLILTYTSSEHGRSSVPLITNAQGISPFPIKISVKVDGVEVG